MGVTEAALDQMKQEFPMVFSLQQILSFLAIFFFSVPDKIAYFC